MGGAIAEGLLKSEVLQPSDITVSDHNQPVLDHFASAGASVTLDNEAAVEGSDIVCVVVKPWCVEKTLKGIKSVFDSKKQALVVVAAGVPSASIKEWMGSEPSLQLFLVMPNIAIAYKESMTYIVPVDATKEAEKTIVSLFDELGESIVMDEAHFPAATAVSCSIAYAMRYIRASVEGCVELGFKAKAAQKIMQQTVKGAVEILQQTGEHPEAAIDKVTTPGGWTIKGLNAMEENGFTNAVIKGLKAPMK